MADPGHSPLPPRTPTSETGLRIMEVARDIISEAGLDGLKARIVAKAAGTSVGTLYNTFGPIEDLVRLINAETYNDLHRVQSEALAQARADALPPTAQLHALAESYLAWVETHQRQWQATLSYNRARKTAPPDWYAARERDLLDIVVDALGGFGSGLSEDELGFHARALWASIHGIVTMAVGNGFWLQPADDVRAQMALVIDAVADQL